MKSLAKLLILTLALSSAGWAAEHSPALDELVASTPKGTAVPVVMFLDNRLTMDDVYPTAVTLPMDARREYVIRMLQDRFNDMSGRVMERLSDAQKSGEVTLLRPLWILNAVRVWATADVLDDIDRNFAEVNYITADAPRDNTLDVEGMGVADMQAPGVWSDLGADGSGVVVAHKDAGASIFHPGFLGHIWVNPGEDIDHDGAVTVADSNGLDDDHDGYTDDFWGWDFDHDNNDVRDDPAGGGHGTKTGSVISANFTPCDTVSVAPGAKLMELSAFLTQGSVWEASQFAILKGARVMSASLSFKQSDCSGAARDCPNRVAHRFVSEMELAAGMIHANSTGNENSPSIPLSLAAPSDCPPPAMTAAHQIHGGLSSIVAVNAVTSGGQFQYGGFGPSGWSRQDMCTNARMAFCGPEGAGNAYPYDDYPYHGGQSRGLFKPDVCALTSVISLGQGGGCSSISGTSGATPHVGGALALIFSKFPGITPEAAYLLLTANAWDLGITGPDSVFGFGKVKPYPAIVAGMSQMTLLTGIVSGPGGPLEGVRVSSEGANSVETGPSGAYNLWLQAGAHTVVFEKYTFADQPIQVNAAGGTITQNITMAAGQPASVTFAANGGGLHGILPIFLPKIPLHTQFELPGEVVVNLYAGRYEVIYGALPWEQTTLVLDVPPGLSEVNLDLHISPRTMPTGPDAYGYRIFDNYDAPTAAYDWIEINPNVGDLPGTILPVGDDSTAVRQLPFTFRYWGSSYTSISVNANGFIMLGNSSSFEWAPQPLPCTLPPNNQLSVLYQDWQPADMGGEVYFYSQPDSGRVIVEWYDVTDYDGTGHATFEAILTDPSFTPFNTEDGVVKYQYAAISGRNPGTVGEENTTGTAGLQYMFQLQYDPHAAPLEAGRALLMTTDSTLDAEPSVPAAIPEAFALHQNYPNPFNPTTTFAWSVPRTAPVKLALFDILGQEAAVVFEGMCTAGEHTQSFDGSGLATGVYFARLESQGRAVSTRKVLLLK